MRRKLFCVNRSLPGTGLGLYLVQEIVAAHGGQLTVESQVGQGATFTLSVSLVVDFVNPLQVVTTYAHVEHMV